LDMWQVLQTICYSHVKYKHNFACTLGYSHPLAGEERLNSRRCVRRMPPINACKASRPQSGLATEGLDACEAKQSLNRTISDDNQ